MPDGLHHHRRPRQAVAGVRGAGRTGTEPAPHPGRCSPTRWPRRRASWPASSGWTPTTPPAACRAPTCSAMQVYLENPDLLHQLAAGKLDGVRQELEAEGWKWVEVSPDRDWNVIHGCGRIYPQPVDVPPELLARERAGRSRAGSHRRGRRHGRRFRRTVRPPGSGGSQARRDRGTARSLRRL